MTDRLTDSECSHHKTKVVSYLFFESGLNLSTSAEPSLYKSVVK